MTEKSGNRGFSDIESQILAIEIDKLRSAIEKMTINDTAITSQSDQLKYQIAALSEASIELDRRLNNLESHNSWAVPLALHLAAVIVILAVLWFAGVLT